MRRSKLVAAVTFAGALALLAAPASAQHRGGSGRSGGRAAPPRANVSVRGGFGPRAAVAPRGSFSIRGGGFYSRGVYAPRVYAGSRYYGGFYGGSRYYYGGPRFYAPVRFYRPYYYFRPRLSLGFGLWIGDPVAYYDPYYYPYAYPYSYAAPYPPPAPYYSAYPPAAQSSVGVQPGAAPQTSQANTGGLSFEITPSDAHVIVDGRDLGTVGQFTPSSQPLGLPAGRHHVEIRADGYRTMSSDVDIIAGQVIPFQGVMER